MQLAAVDAISHVPSGVPLEHPKHPSVAGSHSFAQSETHVPRQAAVPALQPAHVETATPRQKKVGAAASASFPEESGDMASASCPGAMIPPASASAVLLSPPSELSSRTRSSTPKIVAQAPLPRAPHKSRAEHAKRVK